MLAELLSKIKADQAAVAAKTSTPAPAPTPVSQPGTTPGSVSGKTGGLSSHYTVSGTILGQNQPVLVFPNSTSTGGKPTHVSQADFERFAPYMTDAERKLQQAWQDIGSTAWTMPSDLYQSLNSRIVASQAEPVESGAGEEGFGASAGQIGSAYRDLSQSAMGTRQQVLPQEYALTQKLLAQYLPQYQGLLSQFAGVLPGLREQAMGADVAKLRSTLMGQLQEELGSGSQLTPAQAREVSQAQRSAEMARGVAGGQPSAAREAVMRALEGQRLLNQRQAKAGGMVAQEEAAAYNPFQAVAAGQATYEVPASGSTSALASGLSLVPQTTGLYGTNLGNASNQLALQLQALGYLNQYGTGGIPANIWSTLLNPQSA